MKLPPVPISTKQIFSYTIKQITRTTSPQFYLSSYTLIPKQKPPISERQPSQENIQQACHAPASLGFPLSCHQRVVDTKFTTSDVFFSAFILYDTLLSVKDFFISQIFLSFLAT